MKTGKQKQKHHQREGKLQRKGKKTNKAIQEAQIQILGFPEG